MPPASARGYPEARERAELRAEASADRYDRYEEVSGAAGTGAAFVEIGRFSGVPDAIDLVCTGGDAFVRLTGDPQTEESNLRIIVNVPRETRIGRRVVLASNVSDAAASTVRATGKWRRAVDAS